ncbi:MAG: protein TolQ [Rickettsiales bacterium]|nr:MAG: protein TolQ [Rickettsiales bacterium]
MKNALSYQILNIFINADIFTSFLYLFLIFYSVWTWAIVVDKFIKFHLLQIRTEKFDKIFWSGIILEDIYKQVKNNQSYPSAFIFSAVMQEWEETNVLEIVQTKDNIKKESLKTRLAIILDNAFLKSVTKLKTGMTFLDIVTKTATIIGFLITSWNFINVFNSIAIAQDTSLIIIAPQIASALLGLVLSLIVSFIAIMFHTYYQNKIYVFEDKMSVFCNDILTILSKELDQSI